MCYTSKVVQQFKIVWTEKGRGMRVKKVNKQDKVEKKSD